MTLFWFISPAMCLVIRWYLVRENTRRRLLIEQSINEHNEDVFDLGSRIVTIDEDDLDATDRENIQFVYPL